MIFDDDTADPSGIVRQSIRSKSDADLKTAHDRLKWKLRLWRLATLACVLAGIWVDWRFLPTTAIPAASVLMLSKASQMLDAECVRRLNARDTA